MRNKIDSVYYLRKEIRADEMRLAELRSLLDVSGVSYSGPKTSNGRDGRSLERKIERIVNLQEQIEEKKIEAAKLEAKIIMQIRQIDDSQTRAIVYCRNVCCMSWRKIALELGGDNTPDGVRMRYARWMQKK